ncbi:hypothetical protein HG537_0C06460 [Torulaspora globosa]|uniref:alpha-1,2-Mannosidase n=1 Tax=Torulaspora globosa TaxID=48254 RepID=A0A7H9HTG0_9SACH|nr:hypothetical protein HG537_0C06460 [Torulaspora sp. CBS 2947]
MLISYGLSLLSLLCLVLCSDANGARFAKYSFNRWELLEYRAQVKELFYFAHDSYLTKGYPFDEVRPLSCVPKGRNFDDIEDTITNDVLGNFSATLIDSLTTIAIFNDKQKFQEMIELVRISFRNKFDLDSTIQVFETTIRIVGGLISSHLYATDPSKCVYLGSEYDGFLLQFARDMADRLLPAYLTSTGLPLPRINLRHGLRNLTADLVAENNVAAMGGPMFEFTILSYLTGDEKYAAVTRYAMNKTWSLRSELDLLPMSFNPANGQCYSHFTGIGASIDSFYEYALKGAILFDDAHLYEIWRDSYTALVNNCKADWFYVNAQSNTGQLSAPWIDSLGAFFPGLQVLAGDLEDAVFKNMMSLKLWNTFGGIPERWQFQSATTLQQPVGSAEASKNFTVEHQKLNVPLEWYPLRPEFIESTYFLYRATKDPFYLNIGIEILESFKTRFKFACGFGGIQDVVTGEVQDRMETFVLSETLKYLYLLFDEDNELHHTRDNMIFSTEAHPMWLKPDVILQYSQNKRFDDELYLRHLERHRAEDARLAARRNKGFFGRKRLAGLAKSFFADEELRTDMNDSQETQPDEPPICPSVSTSTYPWSYSPTLSYFDRLFEIDYRFSDTLIRPASMANRDPIETRKGFYDQWADSRHASCRVPSTTESFELILDVPGRSSPVRLANGTIKCKTLSGRWKFRVEKLQPGKTDVYGNRITTTPFQTADCNNIFRPDQHFDPRTPTLLYQVTALNGLALPHNATVVFDRNNILNNPEHRRTLYELFGCNPQSQLLLDSAPIINLYLS